MWRQLETIEIRYLNLNLIPMTERYIAVTTGITRDEHSGEKFYFAKHRRGTRNLQRIGRVRFLVHTIVMRAAYPMDPLS